MSVGIVVVGLGYWGPNLARAVSSLRDGRLHGLCDADERRLARFGAMYPAAATFRSLDEVLASPLVVVLDALSDPGNIGAVLRTANAWGAAVVVAEADGKLYHPKSVRAAMGTLFHTPVCQAPRAAAAARIAALGRPVVILTPEGDHPVDALPAGPMVLVLGNEKRGVHARWRELATTSETR